MIPQTRNFPALLAFIHVFEIFLHKSRILYRTFSRSYQRSLFWSQVREIFESLVNRRSPLHVYFVWEWMRGGERSSRMALHLMSATRVESGQLPGSPSMAWAKKNRLQNRSKRWWRRACHFSYTFRCILTCDLFTTILG